MKKLIMLRSSHFFVNKVIAFIVKVKHKLRQILKVDDGWMGIKYLFMLQCLYEVCVNSIVLTLWLTAHYWEFGWKGSFTLSSYFLLNAFFPLLIIRRPKIYFEIAKTSAINKLLHFGNIRIWKPPCTLNFWTLFPSYISLNTSFMQIRRKTVQNSLKFFWIISQSLIIEQNQSSFKIGTCDDKIFHIVSGSVQLL